MTSAQSHLAHALLAALRDDRAETWRLIKSAADDLGLSLKHGTVGGVREWDQQEVARTAANAIRLLAADALFRGSPGRVTLETVQGELSDAAEIAWPGPDAPKAGGVS